MGFIFPLTMLSYPNHHLCGSLSFQ